MKETILTSVTALFVLAAPEQILDPIPSGDMKRKKTHNISGDATAVVQSAYNTTGRKILKSECLSD